MANFPPDHSTLTPPRVALGFTSNLQAILSKLKTVVTLLDRKSNFRGHMFRLALESVSIPLPKG